MTTYPETPQPAVRPKYSTASNPIRHIPAVFGVALILATLFTAWTPSGLLPGNINQRIAPELQTVDPTTMAITGQGGVLTPTPNGRLLVGLVAGHSGNDSGAVCLDGLTEAQINEEVATRVKADLVAQGIEVDILNEFDPKLGSYQALALVSIHADSCDYINDQATGFKVASALANPRPERAARLTACLRYRYAQATGLPLHNSITRDMTSYHAFDEINPETTAAIIEVGFLNLDRQLLTQKADVVARGITDGILCFLNNEDVSPQPPSIPTPTAGITVTQQITTTTVITP